MYRNLPNKGTGHSSKVIPRDGISVIRYIGLADISGQVIFLQTRGSPYYGGALIGR